MKPIGVSSYSKKREATDVPEKSESFKEESVLMPGDDNVTNYPISPTMRIVDDRSNLHSAKEGTAEG